MGQTLTRRPISQRQSFATLNTASNPNVPDLSQYQGYTTPEPMPMAPNIDPSSFYRNEWFNAVNQYGLKAVQRNDSLLDPFRQRAQQQYQDALSSNNTQMPTSFQVPSSLGYGRSGLSGFRIQQMMDY